MCGYPSLEQSIEVVLAATRAGADLIELGMPFSDPLADGPTIQRAGQVALKQGVTPDNFLEVARRVSAETSVPLLMMGYYNPLFIYGLTRFCQEAAACGICGLIVPDLPLEEAGPLREAALQHGLTLVFLVPPTTSNERIAQISEQAGSIPGSFLYCVSLSGVTGARQSLPEHLPAFLDRVHANTKYPEVPIAVGFGISKPEHVSAIVSIADGAVVGSALVNLLAEHPADELVEVVEHYIHDLHQATAH